MFSNTADPIPSLCLSATHTQSSPLCNKDSPTNREAEAIDAESGTPALFKSLLFRRGFCHRASLLVAGRGREQRSVSQERGETSSCSLLSGRNPGSARSPAGDWRWCGAFSSHVQEECRPPPSSSALFISQGHRDAAGTLTVAFSPRSSLTTIIHSRHASPYPLFSCFMALLLC